MTPHSALFVAAISLASLSGCIAYSDGGPSPPAEAQVAGEGIITDPFGPVRLSLGIPGATLPGAPATWDLRVVHGGQAGDEPFPYSSKCHSPWRVTLQDPTGAAISMRDAEVECLAYGTGHLHPGDAVGTRWTWNVTAYDGATGAYQPLEPGTYTLEFVFERQGPDGGTGGPAATHRFHVS